MFGPSGHRRGREDPQHWLWNQVCLWAGLNIPFPAHLLSLQNWAHGAHLAGERELVATHGQLGADGCQHSSRVCDNFIKLDRLSLSYGVYIPGRGASKNKKTHKFKANKQKAPKTPLTGCEEWHEDEACWTAVSAEFWLREVGAVDKGADMGKWCAGTASWASVDQYLGHESRGIQRAQLA